MFMDNISIAQLAAEACEEKKAQNINLIDISKVSSLSDWILITSGLSDVQVRAIVNSVEERIKDQAKRLPLRKEGINEGKWALLDYGELIVNVLQTKERNFYNLEGFWSNGEIIQLT